MDLPDVAYRLNSLNHPILIFKFTKYKPHIWHLSIWTVQDYYCWVCFLMYVQMDGSHLSIWREFLYIVNLQIYVAYLSLDYTYL